MRGANYAGIRGRLAQDVLPHLDVAQNVALPLMLLGADAKAGPGASPGRAVDARVDEMLARLQALSDDHFNCAPDEAGWAMVGTLEHYASLLKRITDSAFGEGEHAR